MKPLTVMGTIESLDAIAQYVKNVSETAGLQRSAAYNLRLAVDEIVTNIITHGYQSKGENGNLYLQAEIDEKRVKVFVEDTAQPYNPKKESDLTSPMRNKPLEERELGGLGIYLALSSVDEFIYQRFGERNCNIFVMYRDRQ